MPVTLADARASLELITAIYHSAETATAVSLPIARRSPEVCQLGAVSARLGTEETMAKLSPSWLRQALRRGRIIHGVDLDISHGEFVVFVGPSGCGKSTLLRMIAGLEEITGGELLIDGLRVNEVPPAKREIAMVFQSYALYPHMTVYKNLAFGLETAGVKKAIIEERVSRAARMLKHRALFVA